VLSTSWLRRSVRTLNSRTARILGSVGEGAFSDGELDGYRAGADRFLAELDEEYYLHYAGLKPELELRSIYERHADLIELDTVKRLGEAVRGRENLELFRFGCEGYLGELTREQTEKVAELEATLETPHEGGTIGYRMLPPTIAGTADRATRARLEQARNELTEEHLNPPHLDAVRATHGAVRELGAASYFELYRDRFRFDLEGLAAQCRSLLDSTERLYEESMDRLLRERVGVGLAEAEPHDLRRLMRGANWDDAFPGDRMVPALRGTLADLGIDLDAQENVHLDVEERPTKTPRAFCAAIEVPDRVMLVIQPQGGPDDWRALFHEAGHTEHFAFTSRDLRTEEKRLGDNAVTEGWAMLFDHLVDDKAWLTRMLDFPRPEAFAAEGAVLLLYFVRRYCAKLLYEIEFHAAPDVTQLRPRYVELLGDALKVEPSPANYLADIDPGYYATSYLRAWAFSAQMTTFLREELGSDWFRKRDAGSLLTELWALGQKPTADELLEDVTGAPVEMEAVAEQIREGIPTPA
jgi:hypothetical protein